MSPTERVMQEIAGEIVDSVRCQNLNGSYVINRDEAIAVTMCGIRAFAEPEPKPEDLRITRAG